MTWDETVYAVTDIETTGGQPGGNSIIEIGICFVCNNVITARYHSLFNPGRSIPRFITGLTGIDDVMVKDAPLFSDEAARIYDMLSGCVFVAHNVNFDFAFIQKSLDLEGIRWSPRKLCTIRLARRAFPGLRSYSLGALSNHLNITQNEAHRALSDAETAALIFLKSTAIVGLSETLKLIKKGDPEMFLPPAMHPDVFLKLPEAAGVYYLRNVKGTVLYIGKAVNIKARIYQHFTRYLETSRAQNFLREVTDITYELTGGALVAGILEDVAIRRWMPKYNRAQRNIPVHVHVNPYRDQLGRLRLAVMEGKRKSDTIRSFVSVKGARNWLFRFCNEFHVSPKMAGLDFFDLYEVLEGDHNDRMNVAIQSVRDRLEVMVIQGSGTESGEYSYVVYEGQDSCWVGFTSESFAAVDDLKDVLVKVPVSSVIDGLIRQAWESQEGVKKILFSS
jgi:DNA polymerase-3 subunit epsilon